ncbi:MAG: ECF transporter S component [Oscillospiraceae bacterium]|nr:ECF transporter S component [Oscillospiraceae bacterium]
MDIRTHTRQIATNSLLAAISLVLSVICRSLIFPIIPFLKLEISDAPIFAASLIFGIPSGLSILFVVSLLKTLFFSIAGWPGFVLRMLSAILILFLGIYKQKRKFLVLIIILAIITYIIIKTPFSYIFWVYLHGMSPESIKKAMLPIIIPFNIFKVIINISFALVIEKYLKKALEI